MYTCRDRAEAVGILRAFLDKVGKGWFGLRRKVRLRCVVVVLHRMHSLSRALHPCKHFALLHSVG